MSKIKLGEFDSRHSMFREQMLEHIFIAEVLKKCWLDKKPDIEILHSEVDGSGYDLVVSCKEKVHHIQFKGTNGKSNTTKFLINRKILKKSFPSLLLMEYTEGIKDRKKDIQTKYFLFPLSKRLCERLDKVENPRYRKENKGKAKKYKKYRKGIYYLPKSKIIATNIKGVKDVIKYFYNG